MKKTCSFFSIVVIAAFIGLAVADGAESDVKSEPGPVTIKGHTFPGVVEIGEQMVPRRGAGLLTVWGFKVYAAAFYAPVGIEPGEILNKNVPCQLWIHYFRAIDRDDVIESADKFLRGNPENEMDKLRERIDRINSWYVDVRKGDEYRLIYRPDRGLELNYNGKPVGVVGGEDFARAYLGIWLSEYALNEDLRQKLLDLKEQ